MPDYERMPTCPRCGKFCDHPNFGTYCDCWLYGSTSAPVAEPRRCKATLRAYGKTLQCTLLSGHKYQCDFLGDHLDLSNPAPVAELGTCDTKDWPHLRSDGTGFKRPHGKRDSCTNWKLDPAPPASAPAPSQLAIDLARELYDRFVMGGWEPQDAYGQIDAMLKASAPADGREEAFKRIMGALDMPPDDTSEYDRWLFEKAYAAGREAGRKER